MSISTNIVSVTFGNSRRACGDRILHQRDRGQVLTFSDLADQLPPSFQVWFANHPEIGTAVPQTGSGGNVAIPDTLIATGQPIWAWLYLHTGADDGETCYTVTILNTVQPAFTGATPTPSQASAWDEAIAELNEAIETADAAASHGPQIRDGYWYTWDPTSGSYVDSGVRAVGENGRDAVVDPTLSHPGEAADAAETGKVKAATELHGAELAALAPEDGAGAFTWTLGKNILDDGSISSSRPGFGITGKKTAPTGAVVQNLSPATVTISGAEKTSMFFLNEYQGDTWLRRTELAENGYAVLGANTDGVRIGWGFANSQGVTMTQTILDENFGVRIVQKQTGGGGTGDYPDLTNKPSINSVTLNGNKSLSDLGAEPEALVVHVTQSGGTYSADYTYDQIMAAAVADKRVVAVLNGVEFQLASAIAQEYTVAFTAVREGAASYLYVVYGDGIHLSVKSLGTYSKPASGIPASDLTATVQASLSKAETSVQFDSQTLTDAQKAQARDNIGAASIDDLGTVFDIKGDVATVADLPATGNRVGDVYYVQSVSAAFVWLETTSHPTGYWEEFGEPIDLSNYIEKPSSAQNDDFLCYNSTSGDWEAKTVPTYNGGSY